MMIETKVIQVANNPETINRVSEIWGCFGWSVTNVQVTHTQNTKTYTKGIMDYYSGAYTVETTTINYATITLQRDKDIRNYQEIVACQSEFESVLNEMESTEVSNNGSVISGVVGGGLGLFGLTRLLYADMGVAVFLITAAMIAPLIIKGIYSTKEENAIKEINQRNHARGDKADMICNKAKRLLSAQSY